MDFYSEYPSWNQHEWLENPLFESMYFLLKMGIFQFFRHVSKNQGVYQQIIRKKPWKTNMTTGKTPFESMHLPWKKWWQCQPVMFVFREGVTWDVTWTPQNTPPPRGLWISAVLALKRCQTVSMPNMCLGLPKLGIDVLVEGEIEWWFNAPFKDVMNRFKCRTRSILEVHGGMQ